LLASLQHPKDPVSNVAAVVFRLRPLLSYQRTAQFLGPTAHRSRLGDEDQCAVMNLGPSQIWAAIVNSIPAL
jgi:hypothetical protein